MSVKIEVVGYKKVKDDLYYLSAISEDTPPKSNGLATYNGFVTSRYLSHLGISESALIGRKGTYYNIKKDGEYKEVLSLSERK